MPLRIASSRAATCNIMAVRPATELLYDSEASYRLVDRALGEFGGPDRAAAGSTDPVHPGDIRGLIREELFGLIAHLHFQDISSAQLAHASNVISEMQAIFRELDGVMPAPVAATTLEPRPLRRGSDGADGERPETFSA